MGEGWGEGGTRKKGKIYSPHPVLDRAPRCNIGAYGRFHLLSLRSLLPVDYDPSPLEERGNTKRGEGILFSSPCPLLNRGEGLSKNDAKNGIVFYL